MPFSPIDIQTLFPELASTERGLRVGHKLTTENSNSDFVLSGYPDDEGIAFNKGRRGAALGPNAIRKQLYKMTLHPCLSKDISLFDCGNLDTTMSLKERHEHAAHTALNFLQKNKTWISLGGGHDYGYADGKAFLEHHQNSKQKPLIINFDAHLDVRSDEKNINSGTPFYRLHDWAKKNKMSFDLLQVGIQPQCNSKEHFDWCLERSIKILSWEQINQSSLSLRELLDQTYPELFEPQRPTFLSVDIDVFSSGFAMGCSQSWPIGLNPESFFSCFKALNQKLDVQALGVYEVSPPLDLDDRTSKLAALIVYNFLLKDN